MITYQVERIDDVFPQIQNLLVKHWKEIALHQDTIKLNPDWDGYYNLEALDRLHIFTAREFKKLVGYFVIIAVPHLHYKDHLYAHNDVIYIDPKYRKGFTAWRLIKFGEQKLKEAGVSIMMINTKRHKPFDKLLTRLGFAETESIYSKRLGAD